MATNTKSEVRGPETESANEFATFELARLGYDVQTAREVSASNQDADDLLLLVIGDELEPKVFQGVVWAVKNRPVNWALHLAPGIYNEQQRAALRSVRVAAGLSMM